MAAVDPALYAFLTASLLHVRSSFRGFAALMQDFHHFPHVEHLHDKLLYAWLVYQAVTQLQDNYWEALQSVSFCFQRHNADLRTDTLGALYLPLQSAFLKDFAQSHQCVTCIRHPVVAFDGKVNRAVPVCCCKTGRTMHLFSGRCGFGLWLFGSSVAWLLCMCSAPHGCSRRQISASVLSRTQVATQEAQVSH
jgi:hypothetical protein